MTISSEPLANKGTVVPIQYCSWQMDLKSPYKISDSITVENVEGLFKPEHFKLWKEYVSPRDREKFTSSRFGLVHRFTSPGQVGREETESRGVLHQAFICLRIVRPTRSWFSTVQFKSLPSGAVDVFSFSRPNIIALSVPEGQILSNVELEDFVTLGRLLPGFSRLLGTGPPQIQRAIRLYEGGYSDVNEPSLQTIVWLMGIEAMLSQNDEELIPRNELYDRIGRAVDLNTPICEYAGGKESPVSPGVRLGDVLEDLFTLRSRFVHGKWIPAAWKEKTGFVSAPTQITVSYADMLRLAATYLLRRMLLNYLEAGHTYASKLSTTK